MSLLRPIKISGLELPQNIILAPLAGITVLPFRLVCRSYGAVMAFTEMVSVNGMVREGEKTQALLATVPGDRPLGVQLFGSDPETLAKAASMIQDMADLVDINMGCPVRKVVATGAGSALIKDLPLVASIIRATRKSTSLPLTIKIRAGWTSAESTFLDIGRIAESEGCDAITLHPRSRAQMFSGHSDWSMIRRLKDSISIPVIGSGDLFTPEDCRRMLDETGCDAVMVARGALGNPWIFRQTTELLETGAYGAVSSPERAEAATRHLSIYVDISGEAVAVREMKKHLGWYIHGIPGAAALRRDVNMARTKADLLTVINRIREAGE